MFARLLAKGAVKEYEHLRCVLEIRFLGLEKRKVNVPKFEGQVAWSSLHACL